MDTVTSYLATFENLRQRKRWTTDTTVLRFAALSLASTPLIDPGRRLEETADALRREASWYDPLQSPVRYAVAATILRRGADPVAVARDVAAVRQRFREAKVPRGGAQETIAALLIALHGNAATGARRVKAILERWKVDHPWLTGANDLPMAALHATRDIAVEHLGATVERIYQSLRAEGFSRGNQLQLASHLLAIDPRGPDEAVSRFGQIAKELRERGETVRSSRYDETALLTLTSRRPAEIASRVLALRDALRDTRPRPMKSIAFSLASGLALAEEAERTAALGDAADASVLAAVQAVLDAQQAAACAAIVAATTAATTASH